MARQKGRPLPPVRHHIPSPSSEEQTETVEKTKKKKKNGQTCCAASTVFSMESCIPSTTLVRSTDVVFISFAISTIRVITGLWRLSSSTEEEEDGRAVKFWLCLLHPREQNVHFSDSLRNKSSVEFALTVLCLRHFHQTSRDVFKDLDE